MLYSYRKSYSRSHRPSFAAIRSRAFTRGRIYHSKREICNYWPMNKFILGGFSRDRSGRTNYSATGISLGKF